MKVPAIFNKLVGSNAEADMTNPAENSIALFVESTPLILALQSYNLPQILKFTPVSF